MVELNYAPNKNANFLLLHLYILENTHMQTQKDVLSSINFYLPYYEIS